MTRTLFIPYTMTAAGAVLCLLAAYPLAPSDWLPRWAVFLAGCWVAVVGIALIVLLTAKEER